MARVRSRLALLGLLAALAVALASGASLSPHAAQAQTPPATFDANGVLTTVASTLQSGGGSVRCALAPFVARYQSHMAEMNGFCIVNNVLAAIGGSLDVSAFAAELRGSVTFTRGGAEVWSGDFSDTVNTFFLGAENGNYTVNGNDYGRYYFNAVSNNPRTFQNSMGNLSNLNNGDSVVMVISLTGTVATFASDDDDDIPEAPDASGAMRSADFESATIDWVLVGPVVEYQVERQTALPVSADDLARIEYGDAERFLVPGTVWGVDSYTDDTVAANKTYRYRVRARRGGNKWSEWSGYVSSGMKPEVDIDPPANVRLSRAHDNSEISVSWTAPVGALDNYTLQRQELVIVEGSTIFANSVTLGGANWLPGTTLTYTDSSILPGRTYEYRLASVVDDGVGDYTDWVRSSPVVTSLGDAPGEFRYVQGDTSRILDDRREFWVEWESLDGADDYEVEVLRYGGAAGVRALERRIVTDTSYFRTAFGRVELRVRARKSDDDLCGAGAYCYSAWTPWREVAFNPAFEAPEMPTRVPDASIDEMQADVDELLNSTLDQSGVDVDPGIAIQFAVLVGTVSVAGVSVWAGWRRGMRPLGMGMGFSVLVISLYVAYVLLGIPAAWPIGAQSLVAITGMIAFARQLGAFK